MFSLDILMHLSSWLTCSSMQKWFHNWTIDPYRPYLQQPTFFSCLDAFGPPICNHVPFPAPSSSVPVELRPVLPRRQAAKHKDFRDLFFESPAELNRRCGDTRRRAQQPLRRHGWGCNPEGTIHLLEYPNHPWDWPVYLHWGA